MIRLAIRARAALALAVCIASFGVSAAYAGGRDIFATSEPVYSGGDWIGSQWDNNAEYIQGYAAISAYSGVWLVNNSGTRVSADAFCSTPRCIAHEGWSGSYPDGHGDVHNHGNGSPDYFTAYVDYLG